MSKVAGAGGGASGGGNSPYQQWPKGTKWAHFTQLPPGMKFQGAGASSGKTNGWVRVGSKMWKDIQAYNSSPRFDTKSGRGEGYAKRLEPVHPVAVHRAPWNPESPQWKQWASKQQTQHDKIMHPPAGDSAPPGQTQNQYRNGNPNGKGNGSNKPPKGPPAGDFGLGKPGVGQRESMSDADALAGLQFDAGIGDARTQLADQHAQGAQDLKDIANWYQQIQGQLKSGTDANAAAARQAAGTQGNVTQGLLDAIGGAANSSSGAVAAQGAGQEASLRQQALLQQQFQSNMGVALGAQQAGQLSAQQALNSQAEQSLGQQIRDLLGQRGQAVVQNRQNIRAFNNSVGNQNFANRISELEAIVGARTALGNQKLQNFQIHQAQAQAGGGGNTPPFVSLSPADKIKTINVLTSGGANGQPVPLQVALSRAKALGYDPVTVGHFLQAFYGTTQ